jgi:hypothetical protein
MYRRTLPSQAPFAGRALIQEMAAVDRASRDKAQIPHGPPDGALAEAARAYAWTPVVQLIGADAFAAEQALVESSSFIDVPIAQRLPLFDLQTQYVSNLFGGIVPLQSGPWQAGDLRQ